MALKLKTFEYFDLPIEYIYKISCNFIFDNKITIKNWYHTIKDAVQVEQYMM